MNKNWLWVGKYVVVIIAALVLGAVLGNLQLFKSATLGTPRLTAAALSQFIAQGAALSLLWALGARLARQFREIGGVVADLATIVLALATLIVVVSVYGVLLHFIAPFLGHGVKPFIDWAFILAILAAAGWLVWALYRDAEGLMQAIGRAAGGRRASGS